MTSKALDLATIGRALNELRGPLGDWKWRGLNGEQQEFLSWYASREEQIEKLTDLQALASRDYAQLNTFLQAHGFGAAFEPFDGIGVASILDMLVQWAIEGEPTTIERVSAPFGPYPAFQIRSGAVDVYGAPGYKDPVLRLRTKTGHSLWLMKSDLPESGLALNRVAQQLLEAGLTPNRRWTVGVVVPMLEMDIAADLSWLLGATAANGDGDYHIEQAFQRFKLRADHHGAHVEVATGLMVSMSSCGPISYPYRLDDPFIGFFTHPDNDTMPLAAFWADTDTWRTPS